MEPGDSLRYLQYDTYPFPEPDQSSIHPLNIIHLSSPILKTLSLCSSLNVREQVSHPYKTKDKQGQSNI